MMKEMQLIMGERHPPDINCDGIENLSYLFENRCLITLEGGETPIKFTIKCPLNFHKVKFTNISSADRTARKITKIL